MLDDYFRQYGLIAMFTGIAVFVPTSMLMLSLLASKLPGRFGKIRPRRPNRTKLSTYECGMDPIGSRWMQFNPRYYYYALLFVVFDVETVFLYPWAVRYGVSTQEFGIATLFAMFVFLGVVTVGYVYAWRKGALEWL